MPAWVASAVLLAAGGIAVFFHLEHWERIFNGFGHMTSGITQELIAIVVAGGGGYRVPGHDAPLDDGATVPKWLCWASVAVCAVLVAVMAHSYTMAARPAWDSVLWILYVLGNACALGPCTMALVMAAVGDETAPAGLPALAGAALGAVTAVAFAASLQASAGAFAEVGFYFDPTRPTAGMADAASVVAAQAPLLWAGAVVIGGLAPLAAAFMGRRSGNWKVWGAVAVACALVGRDRPARRVLRAGPQRVHVLLGSLWLDGAVLRIRGAVPCSPYVFRAPRAGAASLPETPLQMGRPPPRGALWHPCPPLC